MNVRIRLSATITVQHPFLGGGAVKTRGKAQIRIIVNGDGDGWWRGSEFLSVCATLVWLDPLLLRRRVSRRTIEITLPPLLIREGATWAGGGGVTAEWIHWHYSRCLTASVWMKNNCKVQHDGPGQKCPRRARLSQNWEDLWVMEQPDQARLFQRREGV